MEDGKRKKLGDINPHTYQANSGPLKIKKNIKERRQCQSTGDNAYYTLHTIALDTT